MTLGIDEIRTPQVEVEPPEEYFSKMDISKEQKEERVEASEEFQNVILFLFALLLVEMEYGDDYDLVYSSFQLRYRNVVARFSRINEYIESYIENRTREIFDITRDMMEKGGWWTSADRALVIGENEANSVLNYEDLQKAIDDGFRYKTWITERDNRVRDTHREVDGRKIPIEDYFVVGNSFMMIPHDPDCDDAREISNCRCSVKYSKE